MNTAVMEDRLTEMRTKIKRVIADGCVNYIFITFISNTNFTFVLVKCFDLLIYVYRH